MKLSLNIINQLNNLFETKKWGKTELKNDLYARFAERLELLQDESDQLFVLDISKDFLRVGEVQKIYENIQIVFFNIEQSIYNKYNKIIIMPLSKKIYQNNGNTKSGDAYFYFLKNSDFFSWFDYFPNKFMLQEKMQSSFVNANKALFLIDDYVGSGDTVLEIFNDLKEYYPDINSENIYVLAPFAQQKAMDRVLKETGIKIISNTIRHRGISDKYPSEIVPQQLKRMMNIEDTIDSKIKDNNYSLGYKQSEALIQVLDKTPNNTFPVFWYDNKKCRSPFPRRRII